MASRPQELLELLTRAERLSVRRTQGVLDEFDCSIEAWRVLALLSDGQGHNMTAIADCAFLPAPSLTKLMDHLVDQNLVHRRVDPADRRRILAQLTPRGRQYWQRVDRRLRAEWAESTSSLPQADSDLLRDLLTRYADALDASTGGAGRVTAGRTGNSAGPAR